MGGDGKPKPFNIPEAGENPPPVSPRPKPLGIDAPATSGTVTPRPLKIEEQAAPAAPARPIPRPLSIPDAPAPVAATPSPAPRRMHIPDAAPPAPAPVQQAPRPPSQLRTASAPLARVNPLVEQMVAKAQELDPQVRPEHVKGRIDTILACSVVDLLDFGQRNLQPLQDVSGRQGKIVAEMSRIDAAGWIEQTKDASCKRPSFMDRFTAKPPSFYEGMLNKARGELMVFTRELEGMKTTFFREISDLHHDALAMAVCSQLMPDDNAKMTADNRARTLRMAHQTAAIVQNTIEQAMLQCAQFIQQIDQLLSVTIPAWKAAHNQP